MVFIQLGLLYLAGYYWPKMIAAIIPHNGAKLTVQWLVGALVLFPLLWVGNTIFVAAFSFGFYGSASAMDIFGANLWPTLALFVIGLLSSVMHASAIRKAVAKALAAPPPAVEPTPTAPVRPHATDREFV